jgi:hypothetical protein
MTSNCPDIPTEVFFPHVPLNLHQIFFPLPEHGWFQIYNLAETTKVFNLKAAVSNKFDINRCFVQEESNRREAVDHVSSMTGVDTSMTINLGPNAEADALHYDFL